MAWNPDQYDKFKSERSFEDLFSLINVRSGMSVLDRYRAKLRALWPRGPVFYTFRRTLLAATRESQP